MALEGSLTDFGLADILQLIYFQRKTGVLTLESRMDKVKLIFVEGNISGAESKKRVEDNRLGKILVKKGLVGEAELRSALLEQKKTGSRLGQILLKKNLVSSEAITELLSGQVSETVIQLFDWKQGTYEFISQGINQEKEIPFSIDTQHILMEGLRISDEWTLLRGKITLDTIFKKKEDVSAAVTDEEKTILEYVDGENDVSTIIDLCGLDNFQVSKTLLALDEKGLISAAETSKMTVEDEAPPESKRAFSFLSYIPLLATIVACVISLLLLYSNPLTRFKEFRAAEKIEDLRFRIEAYRLSNSAYPQTLGVISTEKDPWGYDYIYQNSGDSFSLLSAGPDGRQGTADDVK